MESKSKSMIDEDSMISEEEKIEKMNKNVILNEDESLQKEISSKNPTQNLSSKSQITFIHPFMKPFKCELCHLGFNLKKFFKEHMFSAHGEK